eukprot:68874-Chlamydomonas_euryale.AAC.8
MRWNCSKMTCCSFNWACGQRWMTAEKAAGDAAVHDSLAALTCSNDAAEVQKASLLSLCCLIRDAWAANLDLRAARKAAGSKITAGMPTQASALTSPASQGPGNDQR